MSGYVDVYVELCAYFSLVCTYVHVQVTSASCGKSHTLFVVDFNEAFGLGSNKFGQLGTGRVLSAKSKQVKDAALGEVCAAPVKAVIDTNVTGPITSVICGADFSMWLSQKGALFTAGMPQYGVLGHGTDHEHNTSHASVKIAYEPQPVPKKVQFRSFLGDDEGTDPDALKIVKAAASNVHAACIDERGRLWTWGCGDYGRLGHGEQKDEFRPRVVKMFMGRMAIPIPEKHEDIGLCCGASWTNVVGPMGQLYQFGKLKHGGDSNMRPTPCMDLSGWNIRRMASGAQINVVGADESVIAWGTSNGFGELGYGPPPKPRSSVNPKKVDSLEGYKLVDCAAGYVHLQLFTCRYTCVYTSPC